MENETMEQRVARVILQRADTKIDIDGVTYAVTPATPATLIMVSALVSDFPTIDGKASDVIGEVLRNAKDMQHLGRIAATLILGAKRIKEHRKVRVVTEYARRWSWRRFRFEDMPIYARVDEYDHVADVLLNGTTIETLQQVIVKRLEDMQVGSFFALTAFLSEVNITKPTKEAGQTAFGA